MIQKLPLILASGSPRRQELLQGLGMKFSVLVKPVDETPPLGLAPREVAMFLARKKAGVFNKEDFAPGGLLTADTIVVMGEELMGKPADETEAIAMLGSLSGRTHEVITAFCLRVGDELYTEADTAHVRIGKLSSEEITHYVRTQPPMDKAGGYGIQDWFGLALVERIEGSYYTVMGLPTHRAYFAFKKMGILE